MMTAGHEGAPGAQDAARQPVNSVAYDRLKSVFARNAAIGDALGALHWDSETMMPSGAADRRARTLATLKVMAHDAMTAPKVAEDIEQAMADFSAAGDGVGVWDRANLAEMRRAHAHATAVPGDLVAATSRAASAAEMVWRDARQNNDFAALKPYLQTVLDRQRDVGQAVGAALGLSDYDALLDQNDPGMRAAAIDPVFEDLEAFLPDFLPLVLDRQTASGLIPEMAGPFPIHAQKDLAEKLMSRLGFDFDRGRLDISLHPFCGGATDDIRITTRYAEDDYSSAMMGVLHETGHALYEQGRPAQWLDQPVGEARGMTLHESQSLFLEMQVSRSRAFQVFSRSILGQTLGLDADHAALEPDTLYRRAITVQPGYIRVDADEVTYPLHVILRYRLERAMLAGDLSLGDLPGAWNDAMQRMLGLTPPDDTLGCLQDIHWPAGIWGYFPTYTLGALAAAQLAAAADEDLRTVTGTGIDALVEVGNFTPIIGWLRENVHALGSVDTTDGVMEKATGSPLRADAFKAHLYRRYLNGGA